MFLCVRPHTWQRPRVAGQRIIDSPQTGREREREMSGWEGFYRFCIFETPSATVSMPLPFLFCLALGFYVEKREQVPEAMGRALWCRGPSAVGLAPWRWASWWALSAGSLSLRARGGESSKRSQFCNNPSVQLGQGKPKGRPGHCRGWDPHPLQFPNSVFVSFCRMSLSFKLLLGTQLSMSAFGRCREAKWKSLRFKGTR